MSFQAPLWLLGLLLVPLVVGAYVLLERRRAASASRFASGTLLPNLVPRPPGIRRHVPAAVLVLAVAVLLVGLARPQAAFSVPREEATIVLALDTSRSMAARDVRPSRLEAVRQAVRAFLPEIPEKYRVGVVSFASVADVVAPATRDREFVQQAVAELRPGEGTALGDAIARALAVGEAASRPSPEDAGKPSPVSVLLLSDGAEMGGRIQPLQAARRARSLGVPVHSILFGTPDGVVEIPRVGGFVQRVRVPPSPDTLRRVASTTRGRFYETADREALEGVLRDLGSRLGRETETHQVTAAFAAGAALLMLLAGALSAHWFRRLP